MQSSSQRHPQESLGKSTASSEWRRGVSHSLCYQGRWSITSTQEQRLNEPPSVSLLDLPVAKITAGKHFCFVQNNNNNNKTNLLQEVASQWQREIRRLNIQQEEILKDKEGAATAWGKKLKCWLEIAQPTLKRNYGVEREDWGSMGGRREGRERMNMVFFLALCLIFNLLFPFSLPFYRLSRENSLIGLDYLSSYGFCVRNESESFSFLTAPFSSRPPPWQPLLVPLFCGGWEAPCPSAPLTTVRGWGDVRGWSTVFTGVRSLLPSDSWDGPDK